MKNAVILAFLASVSGGCTLVTQPNTKQCSTDADCNALGPAFEGTFCNAQSICQRKEDYCFSNEECINRFGSETYICRTDTDHRCVQITSKECPNVYADPGDLLKNPVVVGHLGFGSAVQGALGFDHGLDMARQEFRDLTGGVPRSEPPRPVVIVACDISLDNTTDHETATNHLVDDLNVPIIFGPQPANWGIYALGKAVEKNVLILSSGVDVALDPTLNRRGYLFRNSYSTEVSPKAAGALIEKVIEPQIRAARPPETPATQPVRMALIYADAGLLSSAVAQTISQLKLNGQPAIQNGPDVFRQFAYGSRDDVDFEGKFARAMVDVAAFRPDIVVGMNAGAEVGEAELQIEQQIPGVAHFVMGSVFFGQQPVVEQVLQNESLRKRTYVLISRASSSEQNVLQFVLQYLGKYPGDSIGLATTAATMYDNYYYAMFAYAAVGDSNARGKQLGDVLLTRLQGGTELTALGLMSAPTAIQQLELGNNILYHGAHSTSKFNANGDISLPGQVYCVSDGPNSFNHARETGIRFNPETQQLEGTNNCF